MAIAGSQETRGGLDCVQTVLDEAEVHIAGIPPAGMLIFTLMTYFFRKLALVIASMNVATVSVIWSTRLVDYS